MTAVLVESETFRTHASNPRETSSRPQSSEERARLSESTKSSRNNSHRRRLGLQDDEPASNVPSRSRQRQETEESSFSAIEMHPVVQENLWAELELEFLQQRRIQQPLATQQSSNPSFPAVELNPAVHEIARETQANNDHTENTPNSQGRQRRRPRLQHTQSQDQRDNINHNNHNDNHGRRRHGWRRRRRRAQNSNETNNDEIGDGLKLNPRLQQALLDFYWQRRERELVDKASSRGHPSAEPQSSRVAQFLVEQEIAFDSLATVRHRTRQQTRPPSTSKTRRSASTPPITNHNRNSEQESWQYTHGVAQPRPSFSNVAIGKLMDSSSSSSSFKVLPNASSDKEPSSVHTQYVIPEEKEAMMTPDFPYRAEFSKRASLRRVGLEENDDDLSASTPNCLANHGKFSATVKFWKAASLQQSTSSTFSTNTMFQCQCCFETKETKDQGHACDNLESPHLCCTECIRRYLWLAREIEAPYDCQAGNPLCCVPCFSKDGCESHIQVNLERLFDGQELRQWNEYRAFEAQNNKQGENLVDKAMSKALKQIQIAMKEALTSVRVRACPECHQAFVKNDDGCNKMRCPVCKVNSCYLCREKVSPKGYDHFDDRFNQHKPAKAGKCPLWTDSIDKVRDQDEMRTAIFELANKAWEEYLKTDLYEGWEDISQSSLASSVADLVARL